MTKGKFYNRFRKISKAVKRNYRTALGAVVIGGSSLFGSGCQYAQTEYMNNPYKVSWITREAGRTQNNLDAALPRTYSKSGEELGDNIKRIPADVFHGLDNIGGIVGIRPFSGRFFGINAYEPGIFEQEDKNAWNYKPLERYGGGAENWWKFALFHVPNSISNIGGDVGSLGKHAYWSLAQIVNMGLFLPLTANTHERAKILGDKEPSEYDSKNDSLKYNLDGTTDVVKAPLRWIVASLGGASPVPDTIKYGWYGLKLWAGLENDFPKKRAKIDLMLSNPAILSYNKKTGDLLYKPDDRDKDAGRLVIHAVPVIDEIFGARTTFRETKKEIEGKETGGLEKIAVTAYNSIPTRIGDDSQWYKGVKDASKAPGIIVVENGKAKFRPAESFTYRLGTGFSEALWWILNFCGAGGGGAGGVTGGRGGGGGGVKADTMEDLNNSYIASMGNSENSEINTAGIRRVA